MSLHTRYLQAGLFAGFVCLSGPSSAQTPPVKPQTPDVVIPPRIQIPGPNDPNLVVGRQPITAAEAVAIALQRQVSLRVAAAAVDAAGGRTQQTKSALLPQFSASAGVSDERRFRGPTQGTPNRFSASVGVDQLLFDFGRTRTQVRQQEALERATRFNLEREYQEVALQTRLAYLNFAESERLVVAAEANVGNRQRQLDLANARVGVGIGSPADLVRAKTNFAEAALALESARQGSLDDRISLADQMGVDPRTPIVPAEQPTLELLPAGVDTATLTQLVEEALQKRPEIAQAQQRVLAAGLGVAVAKLTNAPSVSLSGDLNARGADDPFQVTTGSLGVFLSWRFADGGLTAGRTREARAQEEEARAGLEDTSQLIIAEVSRAVANLASARNRVELARVQLANATELLRISEGRYQGEIGQFLEVSDAQSALFNAERTLAQAISDARRAEARLNRSLGRR